MAYPEKRGKGEYPWRVKFKKPDGTEGSASGFRTRQDALNHGREQEADIRRKRWRDPNLVSITLDEYWGKWYPLQAPNWSDGTQDLKRGQYRNHIQPRWGTEPVSKILPIDVKEFEKDLRARRSKATADGVMILVRTMLADAVSDLRLEFSPLPPARRRGKRAPDEKRKGIVTTLEKVEAICERLKPEHALMVLVALFTGMRWSEFVGMRRSFLTLNPASGGKPASGYYVIDPKIGAVNTRRKRSFKATKTYEGRTVELPPFLVVALLAYIKTLPEGRDLLFATSTGRPLDASNFNDQYWRIACDGRPAIPAGPRRKAQPEWEPIEPDLWVHDLRRTHKTWMAEDNIERSARDERLGHATPGMDGVYIKATPATRAKILKCLQRRWEKAHPPRSGSPTWLPF